MFVNLFLKAIACLNKEETDASGLMAERQLVEARIARLAANRDAGRPARVQDTRKDLAGNDEPWAILWNDWDY